MVDNKLIKKTQEVIDKHKEIDGIIAELKDEVRSVYFENKRLKDEIEHLKSQLTKESPASEQVEEQQPIVAEPIQPVHKVAEKAVVETPVVKTTEQKTKQTYRVSANNTRPARPKKERSYDFRNTALAEFFLGKNIIAKLAAIFIFLGIVTFGQYSYVNWLNDVGRVLLILFAGAIFGGIAYYAEKKNQIVFSNVFYIICVAIVYYSNSLASYNFGLYSETIFSYLVILLMIAVFGYFYQKRNNFLDASLFAFYMISSYISISYSSSGGNASSYIEQLLMIGLLSTVAYFYFKKYYKDTLLMRNILFTIFSGANLLILVIMLNRYSFYSTYEQFNMMLQSVYLLAVLYLVNLDIKGKLLEKKYFLIPVLTVVLYAISCGVISISLGAIFNFNSESFGWVIIAISLIPLYILLLRKKELLPTRVSTIYLILISFSTIMYSFVGERFSGQGFISEELGIVIMAVPIITLLVFYMLTKDEVQKTVSSVIFLVFIARQVIFQFTENTFLFKDIWVSIIALLISIVLLAIYYALSKTKYDEDQELNLFYHLATAFLILPVFVTLTNELLSSDMAYIFGVIILLLVGYRWLANISFFDIEQFDKFKVILNGVVVALLFMLNSIYFDHDYSTFDHILKFAILLIYNIYLIFILTESYRDFIKDDELKEKAIIGFYVAGVIIHSIFVINYINFEFDRIVLSSYFLIASAIAVLLGFRYQYSLVRKIGLGAIYLSLGKIFVYDLLRQEMEVLIRMVTFFILGFILLGISILYAYLERTYGNIEPQKVVKEESRMSDL